MCRERWANLVILANIQTPCCDPVCPRIWASIENSNELVIPLGMDSGELAIPGPKNPVSGATHHLMTDKQPKLPNLLTQGKNLAIAYTKWAMAGKPLREKEEVEILFDFCTQCPAKQFIKVNDTTGRCAACGCWLRRGITTGKNKLKWPTEDCPHGLWVARVHPPTDTDNP